MAFSKMKSKITKEYNRQVCLALRSKPNAKNKISAINILAVPVPTYSFGIVHWRVKEIKARHAPPKGRHRLIVHQETSYIAVPLERNDIINFSTLKASVLLSAYKD
ncbi:hypothetical protein DPX16_20201 [Anabarilius grahami]|uniref:Uncharacterized protein n=1 Tax=Anabarilius grahami TaxID=495550 RepID=A0A3N0XEA9_ANAGA|nr:hypothetical protein DPX16_20201 [Anabarilius grahami]